MRESSPRQFGPEARSAGAALLIWPLTQTHPETKPKDRDQPSLGHRIPPDRERGLRLLDVLTLAINEERGSGIEPTRNLVENERGLIYDPSGDPEKVVPDGDLKGVKRRQQDAGVGAPRRFRPRGSCVSGTVPQTTWTGGHGTPARHLRRGWGCRWLTISGGPAPAPGRSRSNASRWCERARCDRRLNSKRSFAQRRQTVGPCPRVVGCRRRDGGAHPRSGST